jgi:hypothetical protein
LKKVFSRQKWEKKKNGESPDLCLWFSYCSQKGKRTIKSFLTLFLIL